MRRTIFILLILAIASCEKRSGFHIEQLTIITQDPGKLETWYVKNLDFEVVGERKLKRNNITLVLEDNAHANHRDSVMEDLGVPHLPGFFKVGFITNQFEQLLETLKANEVDFVGSVVTDPIKNYRMQVIQDPEGNRIQLFEGNGNEKLQPFFVSVIVENIGEQEKWYQLKFNVTSMHNLDKPESEVYIRVLEGHDFLIELIKTSEKTVIDQIDPDHTTGFHELVIHGARGSFKGDHEDNQIVSP